MRIRDGPATVTGERPTTTPRPAGRKAVGDVDPGVRRLRPLVHTDARAWTPAGRDSSRDVCPAYPFSAVVGLDDLRLALLLTAVSPAVGGVLVRGEKGTAKSTVVRALAALLPEVDVVRGCRFACDPAEPDPDCPDGPHAADAPHGHRPAALVELPVGATEDRVVGTLDIQRALADGVKAYEPGLLAAAHRGALYVDEVNLLPDHLVDLLLDAAAMGRAHVERDGVSVKHAARFLLVGTMNPEEGEPRPQLVDRFGLVVTVTAPRRAGAAGRGGAAAAGVRGGSGGVRGPVRRPRTTALAGADRRRPGRGCPGCCCRTPSWTGSPGSAWRTGWTGCAPTSWWPGARWRSPPGTAATG